MVLSLAEQSFSNQSTSWEVPVHPRKASDRSCSVNYAPASPADNTYKDLPRDEEQREQSPHRKQDHQKDQTALHERVSERGLFLLALARILARDDELCVEAFRPAQLVLGYG